MASEDCVEDLVDRAATLLAFVMYRISDLHDGRQPRRAAVQPELEQMHRIREELVIDAARRESHVLPHEREYIRRDLCTRLDRVHKDVRIPWLWPDPSALKDLLGHF